MALAQIGGFADPPGGFGAADQRPVGDRVGELAAQFLRGGFLRELVDQPMFTGTQPAAHRLVALQLCQALSGAQHLRVEPEHGIEGGVQRIESRRGGFLVCDDT